MASIAPQPDAFRPASELRAAHLTRSQRPAVARAARLVAAGLEAARVSAPTAAASAGCSSSAVLQYLDGRIEVSFARVLEMGPRAAISVFETALAELRAELEPAPLSARAPEHIMLHRVALAGQTAEALRQATADGSGVDRDEAKGMLPLAHKERMALDAWTCALTQVLAEDRDERAFGAPAESGPRLREGR